MLARRFLLFLQSVLLLTASQGQTSTLYADGLLRVRGADWRDSRVTVVPEFGDPFEIPLSSDHFDLDLGLESSYLVRAVHEGCAAKEIVFDLRVPVQNRSQVFHFPFEILLEVFKPNEEPYGYAHPVGAVFFDPAKEDFIYTTDYQRISQARSVATLVERMDTHISLHPHPENALAGYEALFDHDPNAWPLPPTTAARALPDSVTAGTDKDSPPSRERPPARTEHIAFSIPAAPSPVLVQPTTKAPGTYAPPVAAHQGDVAVLAVVAPDPESRISTHFALEPTSAQQAMHEFQRLPTMFIQIDRFGNSESTMELRKVTHAYGAVFYFQDGIAITQRAYTEELAKHANTAGVVETRSPGKP